MRASLLLGNDFFNPIPLANGRRFTDDGFTSDEGVSLAIDRAAFDLTLSGRHRMITESGGLRRTDQVDVASTFARGVTVDGVRLTGEVGVALALSGPLGGARMQDAIHHLIAGRHLDGTGLGQLQNQEPSRILAGLVLSTAASVERSVLQWLNIGSTMRASLALGDTGLSSLSFDAHLSLRIPLTLHVTFDAAASVSANVLRTRDSTLLIPGGYLVETPFFSPVLSAGLRVDAVRLAFSAHVNEGGSGSNIGVVSVSVDL